MSAYRARVCTPITFPRGRHRWESQQKTESRPSHKVNVVALNKNPIQWHHDVINIIFKLNLIRFNFDKNFLLLTWHNTENHVTTRHAKQTTHAHGSNLTTQLSRNTKDQPF